MVYLVVQNYHGDGDTMGNAMASYMKAYPDCAESTARHATVKLREAGVIAAKKYWDSVSKEALELQTKSNEGIATTTELLEYWTTVMRGSIIMDDTGRRKFSINAGLKASHELAQVLGMYSSNTSEDDTIKEITVSIQENEDNNIREIIDGQFNEDTEILGLPNE